MTISFRTTSLRNILLLVTILLAITAGAATPEEFKKNLFNGRITPESVDYFISTHPKGSIQKLMITSDGGDGDAGLRFGNWVRDNELDVEVLVICKSACANFVFLAGKRKIIKKGALVEWHGSIEQKNLRELHAKYQRILERNYRDPPSVSDEDRKFLDDNQRVFESLLDFREKQARFHDAIQVNEYITRLGQEPVNYGIDSWTATVQVMEKFGIRNVEAPSDYGTLEYMRRLGPLANLFCSGQCLSFELDEFGQTRAIKP